MSDEPSHLLQFDHQFAGARAAVATKHDKTAILGRALGGPAGLRLQTAAVDTDTLGTFTPETPRLATPRETATSKARWACRASGLDLGIGSEGSFFPHPEVGLVTMQVEHVVLTQTSTALTITGTAIGPAAWTVKRTITVDHGLDEFQTLFSSGTQRLIVRPLTTTPGGDGVVGNFDGVAQGIATIEHLRSAVNEAARFSHVESVIVETDLRAHYCLPRHGLILAAACDLAQRLSARCPNCDSIGYGSDGARTGAPCSLCGAPTATLYQRVYSCPTCHVTDLETIPGSEAADPATCPECNP